MKKFPTVKAHHPVLCAHPDIAVRALGDRPDAIEGQSVLAIPGLEIVLEDRAGRIEGKKLRQEEE